MEFDDLFPFPRFEPIDIGEHSIAPSGSRPHTGATGDITRLGPMAESARPGDRGQFRLAMASMEVPGLPPAVRVGRVTVHQVEGPIQTQKTHVHQRPGWRTRFTKSMEHGQLEVGAGYRLTVATLEVEITEDLSRAFLRWRDECLAAIALLALVLDERIAQEILTEDLIVFDADGRPRAAADHVARVRTFAPAEAVIGADTPVFRALAELDHTAEGHVNAAARWYLRAVQGGPRPDAIAFLWIALEALSAPPWGTPEAKRARTGSDVKRVEAALKDAGVELASLPLSIGRLADLRAAVVHGGVEDHETLHDGYYLLEFSARALLRHALSLPFAGWDPQPGTSRLRQPLLGRVAALEPATEWIDPPG